MADFRDFLKQGPVLDQLTTLGNAVTEFDLDCQIEGKSQATLRFYRQFLAPFVNMVGRDTPLADITPATIKSYLVAMLQVLAGQGRSHPRPRRCSRGACHRHYGNAVGEITACTPRDQAGGSAQLTGLSEDGLIKKTRNRKDQRVVSISITPKGREAWVSARRAGPEQVRRIFRTSLSEEEMETLDRLLRKLRDGALKELGQEAKPLPDSIDIPRVFRFD